jgi:Spy/CpxP family protein refolding chaperone
MKSSSPRLRYTLVLAASLLAFSPLASAAEPAPTAPSISTDATVQKALDELDRVLNTDAKLEEALRTNLDRLSEQSFRAENPAVDALLKKQPDLVKALKVDPQFVLRRSIMRLARVKSTRQDALALDQFLKDNPEIRKPLVRNPSQIMDSKFLIAHPPLARFMESHPALSTVLLQKQDQKATKEKKK